MLNLCLHCGGHHVNRDQIADVRPPPATKTWQPIPHENLLTQVQRSLEGKGLQVVQQAHALWGAGERNLGLMELVHADESSECGLVLGLRNSHDNSTTASIALGSQVFICDHLSCVWRSRPDSEAHAVHSAGYPEICRLREQHRRTRAEPAELKVARSIRQASTIKDFELDMRFGS